jgi:hypothetical protein
MNETEMDFSYDDLIKLIPIFSQTFASFKLETLKQFCDKLIFDYEKNLKRNALDNALKEISEDKYINNSIPDWKVNLKNRFVLFSFGKAFSDLLNEKYKPDSNEYNNSLIENFIFIRPIWQIFNVGIEQFNSFTANSSNQQIAKSKKINFPEKLLAPHKASVDAFDKNLNYGIQKENKNEIFKNTLFESLFSQEVPANDMTLEKIKEDHLDFQQIILGCDMKVIEKKIFKGILNDFSVTKIINGKENESYKVKLLWKLFILTHDKLYHKENPQFDKDKDELNRIVLLRLIQ